MDQRWWRVAALATALAVAGASTACGTGSPLGPRSAGAPPESAAARLAAPADVPIPPLVGKRAQRRDGALVISGVTSPTDGSREWFVLQLLHHGWTLGAVYTATPTSFSLSASKQRRDVAIDGSPLGAGIAVTITIYDSGH